MADNIVLKTYKGGNVTPQDDAIIYETAIPGSGIFKGCEVTYARGNVLHISQGFGMIRGRFFEVYEMEIDVRLADVGEKLDGRVYIHLDLSNTDEPIKILAQTAAQLPPLDADVNINYNNSSYDLELAVFTVSSAGLNDLTKVFPTLKAGSGGGGGGGETLTRATSYSVGDAVTAVGAPGWATLVCTQAGTTAAYEPSGYARITKAGDKVLDGTAVFTARNIIGELEVVAISFKHSRKHNAVEHDVVLTDKVDHACFRIFPVFLPAVGYEFLRVGNIADRGIKPHIKHLTVGSFHRYRNTPVQIAAHCTRLQSEVKP